MTHPHGEVSTDQTQHINIVPDHLREAQPMRPPVVRHFEPPLREDYAWPSTSHTAAAVNKANELWMNTQNVNKPVQLEAKEAKLPTAFWLLMFGMLGLQLITAVSTGFMAYTLYEVITNIQEMANSWQSF
jgi:hypothetical protein